MVKVERNVLEGVCELICSLMHTPIHFLVFIFNIKINLSVGVCSTLGCIILSKLGLLKKNAILSPILCGYETWFFDMRK